MKDPTNRDHRTNKDVNTAISDVRSGVPTALSQRYIVQNEAFRMKVGEVERVGLVYLLFIRGKPDGSIIGIPEGEG